jgi:RIO-like serine/threonine protein kinase
MRLDLSALRYMTNEDFRVLTAIEMGMRNHEIVPVDLIETIAKLKRTNTSKIIANLLKHKLIEHSNIKYDGYSLNFLGYDFLAIHTMMIRGILVKLGPKLGVGKESDVFICYVNSKNVEKYRESKEKDKEISDEEYIKLRDKILEDEKHWKKEENDEDEENEENEDEENEDEEDEDEDEEGEEKEEIKQKKEINENGNQVEEEEVLQTDTMMNKFEEELNILDVQCSIAVIKIARLGRTSFRAVKSKRDYVKNKCHYNWLYLSRLSAVNEFKFLCGLYDAKFSVPKPYDHNRHCILMEYIPSYPLCRIEDLGDKEKAFNDLIDIIISLASKGLIHGDFNEFNILVQLNTQKIFFIDFPQMISVAHVDAEKYFLRDVQCINKFFKKKFATTFENNTVDFNEVSKIREDYLDIKLKAYGHEIALHAIDDKNKEAFKIKEEEMEDDFEDAVEEHSPIRKPMQGDFDLDFDDEIKHDKNVGNENRITVEKIEVNAHDIKMKVKKLMIKESAKQHSRKANSGNRFKAGKKEKIEI